MLQWKWPSCNIRVNIFLNIITSKKKFCIITLLSNCYHRVMANDINEDRKHRLPEENELKFSLKYFLKKKTTVDFLKRFKLLNFEKPFKEDSPQFLGSCCHKHSCQCYLMSFSRRTVVEMRGRNVDDGNISFGEARMRKKLL